MLHIDEATFVPGGLAQRGLGEAVQLAHGTTDGFMQGDDGGGGEQVALAPFGRPFYPIRCCLPSATLMMVLAPSAITQLARRPPCSALSNVPGNRRRRPRTTSRST